MSGMTTQSFEEMDVFLTDTVSVTQDLLNDILQQINEIHFQDSSREYFFSKQLTFLTSDISRFVEVTTLLSKLILNQKKASIAKIKNSHIHLLFILKGMNQAQHKMDTLVLEDLIKYELKDNLTQWKIDLIPQIKRLLNF